MSLSDGSLSFRLKRAGNVVETWLISTYRQYAGGASAETYNINDKDFSPTSWREQEATITVTKMR